MKLMELMILPTIRFESNRWLEDAEELTGDVGFRSTMMDHQPKS